MSSSKENKENDGPTPGPAAEITAIRQNLKLSRAEFAGRLGVSAVAVLRWEKGDRQPSPDTYIRLAKLAQKQRALDLALRFWNKAGVDVEAIRQLAPEIDKMFKSFDRALDAAEAQAVPVVREIDGLLSPAPGGSQEVFKVAAAWVPNPSKTICVAAPDNRMSPLFSQGDLVAIDRSIVPQADDMVLAYRDRDEGGWKRGAHFGWLRHLAPGSRHVVLLEDMQSRAELNAGQFKDALPDIASEPGWSVIAPVIWFVGRTGGFRRAVEWKAFSQANSRNDSPKSATKKKGSPRASVRPGRSRDRD